MFDAIGDMIPSLSGSYVEDSNEHLPISTGPKPISVPKIETKSSLPKLAEQQTGSSVSKQADALPKLAPAH